MLATKKRYDVHSLGEVRLKQTPHAKGLHRAAGFFHAPQLHAHVLSFDHDRNRFGIQMFD
jgi:hypothetical protein